jgi:hypothetical protein
MSGIRCHRQNLVLVAIEREGVETELFVPEGVVEPREKCSRLETQVLCTLPIAERVKNLRHAHPRVVNITLQLAECLRSLNQRAVSMHDSVAGILPSHVFVANGRAGLILLKTIAVAVAVLVDPSEATLCRL